jgi:hypothetical protein
VGDWKRRMITSSNSQYVNRNHEWGIRMMRSENRGDSSNNHNYVCNTADCNTNTDADSSKSSPFGICEPTAEHWLAIGSVGHQQRSNEAYQSIDEETEGRGDSSDDSTFSKSTGSLLGSSRWGTSTITTYAVIGIFAATLRRVFISSSVAALPSEVWAPIWLNELA